jgi:hypothetical protein
MSDRSQLIFGNPIPEKIVRAAEKKKKSYAKKFGYDENSRYQFYASENPVIGPALGAKIITMNPDGAPIDSANGIIVGNIRMGFGHYRIAMAIASAARHLGRTPYWFDLSSFEDTAASKVIRHLNNLYSFGSRLSQRFSLFNRFYWEPLNYEGFKKLSFNAQDQKVAEIFGTVCRSLPSNMPFLGTHVWPAQGAVHAGMKNVVNIIPDNWPMGLHLAEGSLHLVQSQSAYMGYRMLREMDRSQKTLNPIPASDIEFAGHFVDHEIVANVEADCEKRLQRMRSGKPRRILLSVGGAGAQLDFFVGLVRAILPLVRSNKATLLLNFGDHRGVWDQLSARVPELGTLARTHFDSWSEASTFAVDALEGEVSGVHAFVNADIFSAVYLTNLLMRASDLLVTKPSELAYYPVPKLFIKRVGGHEMWGAIRGAELGDGSIECSEICFACQAIELFVNEPDLLVLQINSILKQKAVGTYDGAYHAVRRALERV